MNWSLEIQFLTLLLFFTPLAIECSSKHQHLTFICFNNYFFLLLREFKSSSFSSSTTSSFTALHSANVITLRFSQSAAIWPSPSYLKHLLRFMGLGFGQLEGVNAFWGAWVLCGNEVYGLAGFLGGKRGCTAGCTVVCLGGKFGLHLWKGEVQTRGLRNSRFCGCLFCCCSTLCAKTHILLKVEWCCNSITFDYLGSNPPKYRTIVCSSGS